MNQTWYIKQDGAIRGPFTTDHIQRLATENTLARDAWLRKSTEGDWVQAGEIPGLFTYSTADILISPGAINSDNPFAAPLTELGDAAAQDIYPGGVGQFRFASVWVRGIAILVDALICMCIQALAITLAYALGRFVFSLDGNNAGPLSVMLITSVAAIVYFGPIFYHILFEASQLRATPGKWLMGLKLIHVHSERVNVFRAMLRLLIKSTLSPILLIGFVMAAFDHRRRTLHDRLAGTYVVWRK